MWINPLDLLPGDPTVHTSFNAVNSGVGGGLSGLIVTADTTGDISGGGNRVIEKGVDVPPGYDVTGRACLLRGELPHHLPRSDQARAGRESAVCREHTVGRCDAPAHSRTRVRQQHVAVRRRADRCEQRRASAESSSELRPYHRQIRVGAIARPEPRSGIAHTSWSRASTRARDSESPVALSRHNRRCCPRR